MTRRNVDEDRRPRRFDPKQRGRDHTRTRSRRKRGQTEQVTERRVDQLESWWHMTTSVATQAAATTLIEVVTELPDPTYLDIGRQIILRSQAAVHDILYVGLQLQDDTVAWIQWTSSYEDSPNSPEFTWDWNGLGATLLRGVYVSGGNCYWARSTQKSSKFNISTHAFTTVNSNIPSGTNAAYDVYVEGSVGSEVIWMSLPEIDKLQYWNGSSVVTSSASNDYWAIANDAVGSRLLVTDRSNNRCLTVNRTTLATIATFATGCSLPEGIAADSVGNIYVADTGNHRIRKYNSSLTHQLNFGSSGSADGLLSSPKGISIDSSDRIYVADSGNNRIQLFTTGGLFIGKFGIGGTGDAEFSNPVDVSIDGSDIAVADAGNNRISFWTRI